VLSKADHKALNAIGWSLPRLIETSFKPSIPVISLYFQRNNNYLGIICSIALKALWSTSSPKPGKSALGKRLLCDRSEHLAGLPGIQRAVAKWYTGESMWPSFAKSLLMTWLRANLTNYPCTENTGIFPNVHINFFPWVSPNKQCFNWDWSRQRDAKKSSKTFTWKAILQGLVLSDFWWMLSKIFLETTII